MVGKTDGRKTKTERANQRRNLHNDSNRDRQPGQTSAGTGNQSIGVDHPNRVGRDSAESQLATNGGILSQLISEIDQELAEHEARVARLTERRAAIRALLESLEKEE